jgi:ribosome-binding factor A
MEEYTTRQNKIGRLIQKELSELLRRDTPILAKGKILSVTKVRITKDMSLARCYLSIFPSTGSDEVMAEIKQYKGKLRGELGNLIRFQIRHVPELEFFVDDSLDYIEKIDKLLHQ